MLKKIEFTPDHVKYDALALLQSRLAKPLLSLNFLKELYSKNIDRHSELLSLPLTSIISFSEYKPTDLHYILNTAESLGIQVGALPDWFSEANGRTDKEVTLRFLHLKLNAVGFPHSSPSFNRDQLNYLKEQGIERVYQFLMMDKNALPVTNKLLLKKILENHDYFISNNELENFKVTIIPAKN